MEDISSRIRAKMEAAGLGAAAIRAFNLLQAHRNLEREFLPDIA